MALKKATKAEAKLRMAIVGPAGSGKTFSALKLATELADGKPIALFDTEHGSAVKYADIFTFDVDNIAAPFHPDKFCEAIQEAAKGGYGVVILDSLSHAWNGPGGLLTIVEQIAARMRNPNSYTAWKDATPIQDRLIQAIVSADIHIIATMRAKTDYVLQDNGNGKQTPKKVGMAPVQRDGMDYEFDVVMEMDANNNGIITKTRCSALNEGVFAKPGKQVADTLKTWLAGTPNATPTPVQNKPVAIDTPSTSNQEDIKADIVLSDEMQQDVVGIVKTFKQPTDAWKWSVEAKYYENEHPARTCWTRIVKEKGGYTPAKFEEIASAFVKHQLSKELAA